MRVVCLPILLVSFVSAQYGLYSGYGGGYGGGYGTGYGSGYGGGVLPFMPDPFMNSQVIGYGNPMMGGVGGLSGLGLGVGSGMYGRCADMSPQCSVWASTGQCATNPMMMRQTCALSCGTCATGLPTTGSASFYNPFSLGIPSTGLDQYPLSQFIGRSIYETGRDQKVQPDNLVTIIRGPSTADATFFKGAWSPRF